MRKFAARLPFVLSLIGLLLLLPGYAVHFGFQVAHTSNSAGTPSLRMVEPAIEEGRVRIWISTAMPRYPGFATTPRFRWMIHLWPLRVSLRRAIWEFDCHEMLSTPSLSIFLIAFPIWLAAIPFAVVPVITIRRKLLLKRDPSRGFEVIEHTSRS